MELCTDFCTYVKMIVCAVVNKVREFRIFPRQTVQAITNEGKIKGVRRKTIYGHDFYSFEGIPFAKPPIGPLRFRAPEPPEPWEGVRDCTKGRSKPLQRNLVAQIVEGSEDCLYLNIYVKELKSEKPVPVIVFLHGGGFQIGEGSRDLYAPDFFMERNVVMVNITYRIGAFGFLSLRDREINVPGNAGLKDQIRALEWIKENIHHFGGDRENITLFGQSAGSASANIIMHCERAKGLFHKAILSSGTALCNWSIFPERNWGYRLARKLGYKGPNNEKIVFEFLSKASGRKIAAVHSYLLSEQERRQRLDAPFGPVLEPYETEHTVLLKPVIELVKHNWSNSIPVMIGGTTDEGLLLYGNVMKFPYLLTDIDDGESLVPRDVREKSTGAEIAEIGLKIRKMYFGNEALEFKRHLSKYIDLTAYRLLWHGIYRTVLARLAYATTAHTYVYRFDYDSEDFNIFRRIWCGSKVRGVSHSNDLSYLFHNVFSYKLSRRSPEYKMIQRLVGMWTQFALSSNPNCGEILPTIWEPADKIQGQGVRCLNIGEKLLMMELPDKKKFEFWNSLYKKAPLF